MRILTLSTVFPNPRETGLGLFVHRRMAEVARRAEVKVIAPVPVFDYGNPNRRFSPLLASAIPARRLDGRLDILHPGWFYLPTNGHLNAAFLYARLRGLVRELQRDWDFDVIDAHFGSPEGITAVLLARATGKPSVITLRGNETSNAERWPLRAWQAWALRQADRLVAVSERLRQFALSQGADPARTCTIPNGIDGARFYPRPRDEMRRKWHFPDGTPVILSVGYLIERKGHHRVAVALRDLRDRGLAAQLVIVGGRGRAGNYEPQIKNTVGALGLENDVRFLGELQPDEVAELMSAADVFALATRREGWPNVIHEAMACGSPVVATDIGAIPEMVPAGQFGYVVPFGDRSALSDALARALTRAWERDAISAWACRRTWENVAGEVLQLMEEITRP